LKNGFDSRRWYACLSASPQSPPSAFLMMS
jgi:hypothetical protein